jgi:hypothetical protein
MGVSRRWRWVMPPTVITELWLGQEQREIHQVRDVKGATSALPEDAEPERPRPTFEAHPDLAGTIKGSERRSRLC